MLTCNGWFHAATQVFALIGVTTLFCSMLVVAVALYAARKLPVEE